MPPAKEQIHHKSTRFMKSREGVGFRLNKFDGRYWIRTSDPFRVKEVRYHCANRPEQLHNTFSMEVNELQRTLLMLGSCRYL
ncbi:MAG: hypothetical protein RLZZ117_1103 [Cyanobacteriota bacterium]